MTLRDLISWNRGREVSVRRNEELNPFLTLHREVNRLFDDMFRSYDLAPFGTGDNSFDRGFGWPNIDASETNKTVEVTAESLSLNGKDVDVQLANGVLTIHGEKKPKRRTKTDVSANAFMGASSGEFLSMMSMKTRSPLPSKTAC